MRFLLFTILLVAAPFIAAETEPEPTAAGTDNPPKATGPLSPEEEKFQGTWRDGYTIVVEGREFCADTQPGEWYEGYIVIRPDEEPAQLDFVIVVQSGEPNFTTSKGIFRWDEESIVVSAPPPGDARPKTFETGDRPMTKMRLERDGESQHPATHCLGETS